MATRCKVGDMAFIRRSKLNCGKIGEVLQPVNSDTFIAPDGTAFRRKPRNGSGPFWLIKGNFILGPESARNVYKFAVFADDRLDPIRPTDEPDEIIRLIGLPNKEKVTQ